MVGTVFVLATWEMSRGVEEGRKTNARRLRLVFGRYSGYISGYNLEFAMSNAAQKRALQNYRKRLNARGIARFEVLGLDADRELIRSLAKRLAEKGPEATRIRATVRRTIANEPQQKGGILAALLRSPLVG